MERAGKCRYWSSFDGDRDKAVMDFLAITEMGKFSRR
jgi:hypothetical protein